MNNKIELYLSIFGVLINLFVVNYGIFDIFFDIIGE